MSLDTIIVVIMALAFFGGLVYLAIHGQRERSGEKQMQADSLNQIEQSAQEAPKQNRKRKRNSGT